MTTFDQAIFKRQGERISTMTAELREANTLNERLTNRVDELIGTVRRLEGYFTSLKRACDENENVRDEFQKFIVILKLFSEHDIPGWTC